MHAVAERQLKRPLRLLLALQRITHASDKPRTNIHAQPTHTWLCSMRTTTQEVRGGASKFSKLLRIPNSRVVANQQREEGKLKGPLKQEIVMRQIVHQVRERHSDEQSLWRPSSARCPDGPKPHCHKSDCGAQDPVRHSCKCKNALSTTSLPKVENH